MGNNKQLTASEMGRKGAKAFWKGLTPSQKAKIMSERRRKGILRKVREGRK